MTSLSRLALLSCSEALNANGEAPQEVCIFKYGKTKFMKNGKEGFYLFDEKDADNLIAEQARKGVEVPFDYDHAMLKAGENGATAPAAGFIGELMKQADGLYGRISYWTQRAKDYIKAGEYRYLSPTFKVSRSKRNVTSLYNIALTNKPATMNAPVLLMADSAFSADDCGEGLNNNPKKGVKNMQYLFKMLNLSDSGDMSEEDAQKALSDAIKPLIGQKTAADDFLKLHEVESFEALTAKIGTMVPAEEKIQLENKIAEIKANDAVMALMAEGKITEGQKEHAIKFALKDMDAFTKFYESAPKVVALGAMDRDGLIPNEEDNEVTGDQRKIFENLNLSDEQINEIEGGK